MVSGKAHKAERSSGARFQFCTTMGESTDETEAARALLAAKDFSNLAAMLVPERLAGLPLVGPLITTAIAWVPTILIGWFCLRCLGLR